MEHYVASIDQGTTSTRFMVFDRRGQVIARSQKEHRQIMPHPGWVEHDPVQILARVSDVVDAALYSANISPSTLAAVGITNQRETTLVWDGETGTPYYNAIVWQDTRTSERVNELSRDGGQDRYRAITGLPLATYFSALKLEWILDNVPGARRAAEKGRALFGNIDTFLIWHLTGGPRGGAHVTDVSNASRTMLMNLEALDWDEQLLADLKIPRAMLPEIRPSSALFGVAVDSLAGVPIAGDLGDQQAALFGQTCFAPGEAKNTYGTGCFMLLNTGTRPVPSTSGLLTTVGYKLGESAAVYCLEGSIAIAGALVQWLRDNLGLIEKSADVERLALTVPDNGGIYFVPAFSGLYAPHWRTDARGVIAGLTRFANKGHIARAALEATAYQTREVLTAMDRDSGVPLTSLRVDGGMVQNELLMQFQADILGVPVVRPTVAETTALGAAYAAGLAVDYWPDLDSLRANWGMDKQWTPGMDEGERERLYAGWLKAVDRTLNWLD